MPKTPKSFTRAGLPSRSQSISRIERPDGGWIRAARESRGLTLAEVAGRLKVTPPAVRSFEQAESEDRITLASLRRTAGAMDCELVYALVPRAPVVVPGSDPAAPAGAKERVPRDDNPSDKVTDLTWHAQRGEL